MNWKKSRIIMSLMMLLILAGIGRIVYVDATAAKDKVVLLKSTTTADMIKTTESASKPEVTAVPATAAPEVTQTVTTVAPEVTQNDFAGYNTGSIDGYTGEFTGYSINTPA